MKHLLCRLLDALFPRRVTIRDQRIRTTFLESECARLRDELNITTRERDTARRQFTETRSVNLHNAAAHRATEVAMLRQNHALQVAEARLAGKPVSPELEKSAADARSLADMALPRLKDGASYISAPPPKIKSP